MARVVVTAQVEDAVKWERVFGRTETSFEVKPSLSPSTWRQSKATWSRCAWSRITWTRS
jgi:hypothetical protein